MDPPKARLSTREWEVACLVGEGLTNRKIATSLFISERTVESHLERIRKKLDCHRRSEVAAWISGGADGQAGGMASEFQRPHAAADDREHLADERQRRADERERLADARQVRADQHEAALDARERLMKQREIAVVRRGRSSGDATTDARRNPLDAIDVANGQRLSE